MKRWVNEVHIWALQYTLSRAQIVHWNFLQIAGTPIHFPVRKTDLQSSFGYCGWISKRENYALTKWVLPLFPRWNVFTLFRFLVSTWERIYDYSNQFYFKHRSMWWHNKFWFWSFNYQRVFKDLLTNSTFKETHLSYHVCFWNSEKNHCYES